MASSNPVATEGTLSASGRPAQPGQSERREHPGESVLSLTTGAGPEQPKEGCMVHARHTDRPVRFTDPARNAAYWARIEATVDTAPPLSDEQRAVIRTAFHQPAHREAA